ncbi:E3 ubiquitin-protein ligase RNF19A-like [Lethenteron reissneri]|uniref:E3 ubiquitin-protein ligase RNF19A-like n=1 Tax=Lethenteron reissneri TaxID=7753 RepID=UPI002AB779B7|nr:E3 ubiquitin-protein ligase RNF19A-like [Lethenteron reissneri]
MSLYRRQRMGSERDSQSATSSVSLPSIVKPRKQRRFSLRGLFGRKPGPKPRPADPAPEGVIASIESIHSEMVSADKMSTSSGDVLSDAPLASGSGAGALRVSGSDALECPLCLVRRSAEHFPELLSCPHRSCLDCLRQYLRIEISESRVNICCPECAERLNPHDIQRILADATLMGKYEEFMLRRFLVADPDCRWCPAPDCGFAVIAAGCASCPKLTCEREGCGTEFCYHCKAMWHPNQTCDAARQQRSATLRLRSIQSASASYSQDGAHADDIKPCPRCAAYIMKMNDGSCNHMTCAVCGCEFCWLCMKEISDLHYLSPSGCTFWGKKPWSRKKKILWQLGTLVGAPVGIALIAGVAVPAMIIGIPVYVGRKIHRRLEGKNVSRHRRNLAITGGVALSVIVSPVIAAVTVGIGVPIMLAYVYGVVPVSLCRSGGCGVSTGNGRGVRIEFDDDHDVNMGGTNTVGDTASVAEARHSVTNPSIGESSVGGLTASLSASGSHMERAGVIRDNVSETASTMALAGTSITGSCYSRLEVHADVAKERCSLSGESATVSLAAASDNASTQANAGSIVGPYYARDRDGTNIEVQVDIETRPSKPRHGSGSSGNTEDVGFAGAPARGPPDTKYKGGKRMKECGLSKKGKASSKRKASMKIKEVREDMDTQLLERGSVHSSELDSPSLSDSMPSVADSHSSHFSEFSDRESTKTTGSSHNNSAETHATPRYMAPAPTNSQPLTQVESDRLEGCPSVGAQMGAVYGQPGPSPTVMGPCATSTVSGPSSPSLTLASPSIPLGPPKESVAQLNSPHGLTAAPVCSDPGPAASQAPAGAISRDPPAGPSPRLAAVTHGANETKRTVIHTDI